MFELPDLAYAYDALEPYIDEQTMHLHHDKHHAGYVSKLNDALKNHNQYLRLEIDELMKELNSLPDSIKTPVRNHGGGHANHSLFWKVMSPKRKSEPEEKLEQMLRASFGDFQKFKETFAKAALGRFGSGWAWLVVDKGKLEVIDTPNQDTPLSDGQVPILGLDVWEHAYYLKYQNLRNDYIEAWWNVVNWGEVEINLSKAL